jgi:hypothetical protein
MGIVAHEHGPVLSRIRILLDLLRYDFSQARVLGEPLPSRTGHRMPADFNGSRRSVENWGRDGDNIRLMAKADGLFQRSFSFADMLPPC